jgi:hypothetical protein
MNKADIILIVLLAVILGYALYRTFVGKKAQIHSQCSGDCASCSAGCSYAKKQSVTKKQKNK